MYRIIIYYKIIIELSYPSSNKLLEHHPVSETRSGLMTQSREPFFKLSSTLWKNYCLSLLSDYTEPTHTLPPAKQRARSEQVFGFNKEKKGEVGSNRGGRGGRKRGRVTGVSQNWDFIIVARKQWKEEQASICKGFPWDNCTVNWAGTAEHSSLEYTWSNSLLGTEMASALGVSILQRNMKKAGWVHFKKETYLTQIW